MVRSQWVACFISKCKLSQGSRDMKLRHKKNDNGNVAPHFAVDKNSVYDNKF